MEVVVVTCEEGSRLASRQDISKCSGKGLTRSRTCAACTNGGAIELRYVTPPSLLQQGGRFEVVQVAPVNPENVSGSAVPDMLLRSPLRRLEKVLDELVLPEVWLARHVKSEPPMPELRMLGRQRGRFRRLLDSTSPE